MRALIELCYSRNVNPQSEHNRDQRVQRSQVGRRNPESRSQNSEVKISALIYRRPRDILDSGF
jgi:hypothetical protein